jgi:ParB family chromosome partitioning protein
MSARRGGLGRGLGALISSGPAVLPEPGLPAMSLVTPLVTGRPGSMADAAGEPAQPSAGSVAGELRLVPITDVVPNPRQPRTAFDEGSLEELAASIRAVGLLQPIVVREMTPTGERSRYELVMGERRWRASQLAELAELPAIVRMTADDALLRDALIENLHREQLNPLEEAAAYEQLLNDFGCTHDELAARVSRSRSHVTNTLRLLGLPAAVQRRVAAGVLSAGHARALLALADPAEQEALAIRVTAEGLSVRAVEELVALGSSPSRRLTVRAEPSPRPELEAWASRLSEQLETRVKVAMGRRKGQITVEFATVDDLARIAAAMVAADPRHGPAPQ